MADVRRTLTKEPTGQRRTRLGPSGVRLDMAEDTLVLTIPSRTSKVAANVVSAVIAGIVAATAAVAVPWSYLLLVTTAGALISYLVLRQAHTRQELRVSRDGSALLCRFRGTRGRAVPLPKLQVALESRLVGDETQGYRKQEFITAHHGPHRHELLHEATHEEKLWVVEELEQWLNPQRNPEPAPSKIP